MSMSAQDLFRSALLDPAAPVPEGLTDAAGAPTVKRFAVYRNNVTTALVAALRTAFPVLRKLLGEAHFDQVALSYARTHPPRSPLMMHYGADMPAFLDRSTPLRRLGYLPDVARLELAMRQSYHAADTKPLDPRVLTDCPPDRLMASVLTLSPATFLVPSDWPLFDIWRFNTVAGAPKPRPGPQPVLITRPVFDPEPNLLAPAQAAWVAACIGGASLSDAQDAATDIAPEFDLAPLLSLLLRTCAMTSVTLP